MKKLVLMILIMISCLNAKDITLGDYKDFSKYDKEEFLLKNLDGQDIVEDYYKCMGDFSYSKSPQLSAKEVLGWCKNEYKNNKIAFYSHINELELRKNGSFKVGFDPRIDAIKKAKKLQAQKRAIKEQEKSLKEKKPSVKRYKKPSKALEGYEGIFKIKKINKPNDIILSVGFYKGDMPKVILEEVKRTFIYGIYIPLIHTKYKKMTITIIPYFIDTKELITNLSFKGTVRKRDALKVAKKLLHINKLSDLVGGVTEMNGEKISFNEGTNKIFRRALYNDQGTPTLDVFFQELSKVTK